jgi:hypothetical protein
MLHATEQGRHNQNHAARHRLASSKIKLGKQYMHSKGRRRHNNIYGGRRQHCGTANDGKDDAGDGIIISTGAGDNVAEPRMTERMMPETAL